MKTINVTLENALEINELYNKEYLLPIESEKELYSEEDYDNMLDECYPDIKIGYISFSASRILSELDPIAYNCGFSDYQKYETIYTCPICGKDHEDEDEAFECCQEIEFEIDEDEDEDEN